MMRLENESDASESWMSSSSIESRSEINEPCRYRDPRLKLLGSFCTLAWGSFGFLLTTLGSVETNQDGIVPLSTEMETLSYLVWRTFAIVYAATILFALVRIVAICRVRFLERRPNHTLGLPRGIFLCIHIVLAAATIAASFVFFRLRLGDQVSPISWPCFLYSWLIVLTAAWNLIRRYICCPNPVEACRQGFVRLLGTTHQRTESAAGESAVDFVEELFAHAGKVSYNNFFDVMILLSAYQHRLHKSSLPNRDLVVVESQNHFVENDISYYKQYANAAYDYSLGYTSRSLILLIRKLSSKEGFARRTSIVNRVVLLASSENKTRKPVFFVAVDHDKRSLVISICGTVHITDICTDMEGVSVPLDALGYPGSFAHSGILNAALAIEKETFATKDVELFLQEHPDYEIVTTGHSLGAGVASLLAMLLQRREDLSARKVQAIGFASPPCLSVDIGQTQEIRNIVTNVVIEDDVVCRLSFRSLKKMLAKMEVLLHRFHEFLEHSHEGAPYWWSSSRKTTLKKFLEALDINKVQSDIEALAASWIDEDKYKAMTVPGELVTFRQVDNEFRLIHSVQLPSVMEDIIVSKTMLFHHLMAIYEEAIESNSSI